MLSRDRHLFKRYFRVRRLGSAGGPRGLVAPDAMDKVEVLLQGGRDRAGRAEGSRR
jgi:hypothetical protein